MIKIEGLDEIKKQLDGMTKAAEEMNGSSVSMDELLNYDFLASTTKFSSMDEMFAASGFLIENQQDFEAIPEDKWNDFIRSVSSFNSWEDLLDKAGEEWAAKKLGF